MVFPCLFIGEKEKRSVNKSILLGFNFFFARVLVFLFGVYQPISLKHIQLWCVNLGKIWVFSEYEHAIPMPHASFLLNKAIASFFCVSL